MPGCVTPCTPVLIPFLPVGLQGFHALGALRFIEVADRNGHPNGVDSVVYRVVRDDADILAKVARPERVVHHLDAGTVSAPFLDLAVMRPKMDTVGPAQP